MDAFVAMPEHAENNLHANFHCGVSATSKFCYKIACVSLANQSVFYQYALTHIIGCKRGLTNMVGCKTSFTKFLLHNDEKDELLMTSL